MIDEKRLAPIAAFVATGLSLISFLMLLAVCAFTVAAIDVNLGDRIPFIYVMGTVAGLTLAYAKWEYRNLRLVKSGS